jgi:hypothetical protein
MYLTSTTVYKRPRNVPARASTGQTPRSLGEPDTSTIKEEEWNRFEQRRHRMQPPDLFDEAVKKFEKFAERSSASRSAPFETEQRSKVGFQDLRKSDSIVTAASICIGSAENQIQQPVVSDIGLRKARFYDSCLRADRSVESPRLPKAPKESLSAREPRASLAQSVVDAYPSSNEKSRRSVTGSPIPRLSLSEANASSPREVMQEAAPVPGLSLAGSLSDLMVNCRQKRLTIATTGLVRAPESKRLDLEFGFLTDTRAEAMNLTVKAAAADVKDASFRSNSLTDKGVKHVLDALPDEVEKIDLSLNDLSRGQSSSNIRINRDDDLAARSGWCSCFKRFEYLTTLIMSDCQIGDGICEILCDKMRRCRSLVSLNLSGNNISKSGLSIRNLIKSQKKLEILDLQWNQLAGDSAIHVIKGLIDICKLGSGQLRSLNLSYNPLGKEGGEEIATHVAKFFAVNRTLLHLDISKCEFSAALCQILAEGLKENTTLLGLHLDGNEARLDSRGFMIVDKLRQLPIQSLEVSGDGPQRQVERNRMIAENVEDRCWICERWEETRISYIPGVSGPDAEDVWVFTSLDDFEQPLTMQRVDDELVLFLLAPPGPLFYCIQAGKELLASRTAPSTMKSEMHLLPAHLRSSTFVATGSSIRPPILSSMLRLRRTRLPTEIDDEAADADAGKDPLVIELPSLSRHHVGTTRPSSSTRTDDRCCKHFIPRRPGEYKGSVQRQEWTLQSSLFAPFTEALSNRGFCESCFEVDWAVSGIGRLFKDEADRSQVRDILRNHYAEIKVLYNSLCSVDFRRLLQTQAEDRTSLGFGVGLHEFTHMIVQHNLVSQDFTLAEVDAQFFMAAAPPPEKITSKWINAEQTEGRLVQRHAFFELLVRIALARFLQGDIAQTSTGDLSRTRGKVKSASKAIEQLFKHHIMYPYPPMKNNFKCVQWRVDVLQTEVVETVLRKHMKAYIDPLFSAYSRKGVGDQQHHLRPEDWFLLLDALDVFPYRGVPNPQTAIWDRVWLWQSSVMAQIDELRTTRHLELTFVEFLEAISRLVGLLHSRKAVQEGKAEDDDWNYGMSFSSASSVFCVDQGVMNKEIFARYLDTFLHSSKVKQAIELRRVD